VKARGRVLNSSAGGIRCRRRCGAGRPLWNGPRRQSDLSARVAQRGCRRGL